MSSDDESNFDAANATPPKKKRKPQYDQVYLKKWEENYKWLSPAKSKHRAYCQLCRKEFSISHGGQYDVKQHSEYKTHKEKEKGSKGIKKKTIPMEQIYDSDSDSLEDWDVVNISQVLLCTDATTVVTGEKNGLKSPPEEESSTGTPDAVPTKPEKVSVDQPENGTKAIPEQCDEDEPRSESESRREGSKVSSPEPETQILAETTAESNSIDVVANELKLDPKISVNIDEENSTSSEHECTSEIIQRETVQDIVPAEPENDTVTQSDIGTKVALERCEDELRSESESVQNIVCGNTEKESSPVDVKPGSCQEPDVLDADKVLAASEEFSDIDIVHAIMGESNFSTSAGATSMASVTSHFADIKHYNQEQKEEPKQECIYVGGRKSDEIEKAKGMHYPGTSSSARRSKRSPCPRQIYSRLSRGTTHRTLSDWFPSHMVTCLLYLAVMFALVDDTGMSQMKHNIEELKHDNKILKNHTMSEIKKAFSSFEHQINDLREENLKLNKMLFVIARHQEKKEAEYLAHFEKEINKLKEFISVQKIDNEELQKELAPKEEIQLDVESLKKYDEHITLLGKDLEVLAEAEDLKGQSSGRVFLNNLLKNIKSSFNSFQTILSKVFSEYKEAFKYVMSDVHLLVKDNFTPEKTPSADEDYSERRNKNPLNIIKSSFNSFCSANLSEVFSAYKEATKNVMSDIFLLVKDFCTPEKKTSADKDYSQWGNKNLLNNINRSFNSFRNANLSEVFLKYREAKKKILSDICLQIKDFFTPGKKTSANKDNSQWKRVGDFMEDLKDKWINIKDRLYASDLRKF